MRETTPLMFEKCGNSLCTDILIETEGFNTTLEKRSDTHDGIILNPFEGVVTILDEFQGK